jgi:hypothetical protein
MSARHDHLFEALRHLLATIEQKDAAGAEAAMEQALDLFASTPAPGDDERLRPLMMSCETAARALHAELGLSMMESATSARAAHAYADGGGRETP